MREIKFSYRDAASKWQWRKQSCRVSSVDECIRIYGLEEPDVEYRIDEVIDTDTGEDVTEQEAM